MLTTRQNIHRLAWIKGCLGALVLVIMLRTFPYPLPLTVSVIDLILVPVYVWGARRYPIAFTYALIAETTLAFTPRQFVQGYVNGINWVFYIPLPLAAWYIARTRRAAILGGLLVTVIAMPIMLIAAIVLPPRVERSDLFTLIAYVVVVLWGALGLVAADQPSST
jgi:hypothetical protein